MLPVNYESTSSLYMILCISSACILVFVLDLTLPPRTALVYHAYFTVHLTFSVLCNRLYYYQRKPNILGLSKPKKQCFRCYYLHGWKGLRISSAVREYSWEICDICAPNHAEIMCNTHPCTPSDGARYACTYECDKYWILSVTSGTTQH